MWHCRLNWSVTLASFMNTPLPIQFPSSALGKAAKMTQVIGSLHLRGRPGRSELLALAFHRPSCGGQLGSEPVDGRVSFALPAGGQFNRHRERNGPL